MLGASPYFHPSPPHCHPLLSLISTRPRAYVLNYMELYLGSLQKVSKDEVSSVPISTTRNNILSNEENQSYVLYVETLTEFYGS
jgi:hypothetical protein